MKRSVILCVDDEPIVLKSIKAELKDAFGDAHVIETTESGSEALKLYEELCEDGCEVPVVISDYLMPGIKGDELLIRIHEKNPRTLKIMLTGQATTDAVGNAINKAKLYRYISKPWDKYDLVLTVREAVKSFYQDKMLEKQNQELRIMNEFLEEKVQERTLEIIEKNKLLEKQRNEIEQKNKKITDSIIYAQRIQQAILPIESVIRKILPDFFVIFEPKDIVSGDFYWVEEKDNILFFSTVDCTGHGVPGAFISIIGYNILNQALHQYQLVQPSKILYFLNKELHKTLRQDYEDFIVKAGMDIALCALNKEKKVITFSGAHNPLYLIRNGELLQFKSNYYPIGVSFGEEIRTFEDNEIQIEHDDLLYIFSDGYIDQFGGPKRKKFLSSRLREILLQINMLPMHQQKEILINRFAEWKGDNEQVDDVLVLGIKIKLNF